MKVVAHVDGGARGNPGPAAAGIHLLYQKEGMPDYEEGIGQFLGLNLTNNQAEYWAVILALKRLTQEDVTHIVFFLDSQLLVNQLNDQYRVKDATLKKLYQRVKFLCSKVPVVEFNYIPREKNQAADALVNEVLNGVNSDLYDHQAVS